MGELNPSVQIDTSRSLLSEGPGGPAALERTGTTLVREQLEVRACRFATHNVVVL